jgi:hypothetical protein
VGLFHYDKFKKKLVEKFTGGRMTVLSEEVRMNLPFIFQHCLLEDPRTKPAKMGRKAGISRRTAKTYLESFISEKIMFHPQMRLRIGKEIAEYVYLMEVKDINSFLPALEKEEHVFYYCLLAGSFNLLFMSYKPIDFSHLKGYRRTVISGLRSNYYVPRIMNKNYEMAYRDIENACRREIDTSVFDLTLEEIHWTQELWDLYLDLKYNISIDFTPLVKKHRFNATTFYERIKEIQQKSDVYIPLYPLGEPHYTFFYFLIRTKYQRFVAECFGNLPVFTSHARVKDCLLSNVPVPHGEEKQFFGHTLSVLEQRGIIDSYDLSVAYWSDRINNHPGMPPPPPLPPPPSGNIPPLGRGKSSDGKVYTSFM